MIFTTYWFGLFAGVFFLLYWSARLPRLRMGILLAGCFAFYGHFAGAAGMLPIVVLAATTYMAGLWRHRAAQLAGLALPVLALVFYKYTHFLATGLVARLNPAWGGQTDHFATVLLPLGPPLAVSFFTFEFVHYLYDVGKGSPPISVCSPSSSRRSPRGRSSGTSRSCRRSARA